MSAITGSGEVDDCWNRIGVQGDNTCAELKEHIHCRNCGVYAAAARSMLDVPLPPDHVSLWTRHYAKPRVEEDPHTESVLIFRSSNEWLALSTARCEEVASDRAIRTLPHRRSPAVLGLANVRGELVVCLSLAALLAIHPLAETTTHRLLIVRGEGVDAGLTALKVDEVHGTFRYNPRDLTNTANPGYVRTTLRWREHTVGVLDDRALLGSIARGLA
jgi:chemotaxis-related protein WspD